MHNFIATTSAISGDDALPAAAVFPARLLLFIPASWLVLVAVTGWGGTLVSITWRACSGLPALPYEAGREFGLAAARPVAIYLSLVLGALGLVASSLNRPGWLWGWLLVVLVALIRLEALDFFPSTGAAAAAWIVGIVLAIIGSGMLFAALIGASRLGGFVWDVFVG